MCHGNLDAIVAPHQDTILGSPEVGNAHRQPDADRQQRHGEGESGHICQHPLPIFVGVFVVELIARQVVGDFEPMDKRRMASTLSEARSGARPEFEHAVLMFRRGRYDGSLGSHGCQLRDDFGSFSTPALFLEVEIRISRLTGKFIRLKCHGTCRSRFESGRPRGFQGYRHSAGQIGCRYDRRYLRAWMVCAATTSYPDTTTTSDTLAAFRSSVSRLKSRLCSSSTW